MYRNCHPKQELYHSHTPLFPFSQGAVVPLPIPLAIPGPSRADLASTYLAYSTQLSEFTLAACIDPTPS